jgi:hypothetical protein
MADRYNEGKALDAVLRFIEARDDALRKDDGRSPDDPNNPDPMRRVDYVCTVGQTLYALEHTRIEPFPNQIRLAEHNQKLLDPIIKRFDHRPDLEVWDLYVPVEASASVNDIGQVQEALIKWIDANWERFRSFRATGGERIRFRGRKPRGSRFGFLCGGRSHKRRAAH